MSGMQRFMNFLGLTDEEFLDDDDFVEEQPRRTPRNVVKGRQQVEDLEPVDEPVRRTARPERTSPLSSIRPISSRPSSDLPPTRLHAVQSGVRQIAPEPQPPQIFEVQAFRDVQRIAMDLREGRAVIVNLQHADSQLQRRVVDFISGATYVVHGKLEKVSDKVFLASPSNVSVTEDDRSRARRDVER